MKKVIVLIGLLFLFNCSDESTGTDSTIKTDSTINIDSIVNIIDTFTLTIKYKDTMEYDTIFFTIIPSFNGLNWIGEDREIKAYNVLLIDTIKEGRIKVKDTLGFFYNTVRHGIFTRYIYSGYNTSLECYQNGVYHGDTLEPCFNDRNTGTGVDTLKDLRDSLYLVYEYQNGQLHGLSTWYKINGKIDHTQEYYNGVRNGIYTRYLNGGGIWDLHCYLNGVLHSTATEEEKREEENNPNSFICLWNGIFSKYNSESSLEYTQEYENGVKHGLYTRYDYNGPSGNYNNDNIKYTQQYENGVKHGLYTRYFSSGGGIYYLHCYQNGVLHSTATEEEEREEENNPNSFICLWNGIVSKYNSENSLEYTQEYENGEQHGFWAQYFDGYIYILSCYQNGILEDLIESCLNGRNTGSGTDAIVSLINGKSFMMYEYQNGQLHGLSTRYNLFNNNIHDLYCYQNGVLHSTATEEEEREEENNPNSFSCP